MHQLPPDDRPHIVHILGSLSASGAQRNVYALITHPALGQFRHSVVCVLSDEGRFRSLFERAGIPVYFCPVQWPAFQWVPSYRLSRWLRRRSTLLFPMRLGQALHRLGADLVHTNLVAYIGKQAQAVLQFRRLPLIWTVRGLYRSRGELGPDWPTALRLMRRSDRAVIVGVSRAVLDDVLDNETALPADKARVIYNGLDLTEWNHVGGMDKGLRAQWGIPPDAVVFGAAGRLIPIKRFDLLIEALARVIAVRPDVHLVLAGEGPLYNELLLQAQRLGIEQHVHLIGYQSDMAQFWTNVEVCVTTSDSEGHPMTLLEACACGVPCISTRVGGIPEVIQDGEGILVEPGNPTALAAAMAEMLDPRRRAEYSRKSRGVAERFSLDRTANEYAKLYEELLSSGTPMGLRKQ